MLGILLVGLLSALLCSTSHYLAELWQMGRLPRYVVGLASVGLPFLGWVAWQPALIAGVWVAAAFCSCAVGAGLGTLSVYLVDHVAGQARVIRTYEVQHEQPARRAAADRE